MQSDQHTQPFNSLFEPIGRTYRIPEYQRAYAWGETQIDQFLEDLRDAQGTYYLGHYLFERHENGHPAELLVVDGQQRLTTCVLFFNTLCRQLTTQPLTETEEAEVQQWRNLFLRSEASAYQPRLTTVSYDNAYFQNILEGKTSELARPAEVLETNSQRLLREAYAEFDKVIKKEATNQLLKWGRLVASASITQLVVPTKKEAAQLFAFQNDRGKSLTALETIKSYFMLQVLLFGVGPESPASVLPELEDYFTRIYKQVTRIKLSEDDVLNYYWRSTLPNPYNGDPVVGSIKKAIGEVEQTQRIARVRSFVEQLASAFEHVAEIENDTYESARDLRTLDHMALVYPLLLRAYRDGISRETKERLFRFLENITFRYKLRGGRAVIHDRFVYHFFNDIPALRDEQLNRQINQFVAMLRTESWNWGWHWGDEAMQQVLNQDFYSNPVDNYLLWRYERHIRTADDPQIKYDNHFFSNESIEHIAPQTPRADEANSVDWPGYGTYYDTNQPTEGIASGEWLHKLGNLMLLAQGQNTRVGNRPFTEKLIAFREGLLKQHRLDSFLAPNPDKEGEMLPIWDKAAIERRHKEMVAAAQDIWSLSKS